VNAEKFEIVLIVLLVLVATQPVCADSARDLLQQGNKLYARENFNDAIKQYDQALVENPQALEPKFNKANSYYRLDDLATAIDLYKEVAADSKDMKLVAKAKYNLGNTFFQQGLKQRDSNLQKALDDLKTSISYWRQVLDIEPENENAAKNIEVARLIIKDIIDQINKQKQEQDQQQQNQQQDQQQQGQQQQDQQGRDPNQPPSQQQQPQQEQEQEQEQEQGPEEQEKEEKQAQSPDATAQEILDNEQRQKEKRQILQRGGWQKVEKDW
jgi:Ca-activated chloride channel family protein